MCLQVVVIQARPEYASVSFPEILKEFKLSATESHHKDKKDVSGTAKEVIELFSSLGAISENNLDFIRNPSDQEDMGVEKKYINSHAWHKYDLASQDGLFFYI